MNWYELAGPDEVKAVLETLLDLYSFSTYTYERTFLNNEPVRVTKYPSQAYEIAEALWGEYGKEVL